MKIYTKTGDDGTTGLLYGGRVAKTSLRIEANGAIDETQAALGCVRAETEPGSELDSILVGIERDLYVAMAEMATADENRHKLVAGTTMVSEDMVVALEKLIDQVTPRFEALKDFVVPGANRVAAGLDMARTVCRRAERAVIAATATGDAGEGSPSGTGSSLVTTYLNRLSDLIWTLARWQEQGDTLLSRQAPSTR
ncbi:MAG: cob(I)yrinic acid a,c-diamide adenosyltransferase [Acidimicrobiales bacterium]